MTSLKSSRSTRVFERAFGGPEARVEGLRAGDGPALGVDGRVVGLVVGLLEPVVEEHACAAAFDLPERVPEGSSRALICARGAGYAP